MLQEFLAIVASETGKEKKKKDNHSEPLLPPSWPHPNHKGSRALRLLKSSLDLSMVKGRE